MLHADGNDPKPPIRNRPKDMQILISSRSEPALPGLKARVPNRPGFRVECVLMINGEKDPLAAVDYCPDVLVLHSSAFIVRELSALAERPMQQRPALVVVGDQLSTEALKLAVRAGAREILGEQELDQLAPCLDKLARELGSAGDQSGCQTVAVINAKGGCGGTFIATSLAHLSATVGGRRTGALDLDFQYAPLPQYLDVRPKRGLLEALAHATELDDVAVQAFAAVHDSGLEVIAPLPEDQAPVDFAPAERMTHLLGLLRLRYERLIIDVPRFLDDTAATVLGGADEVLIVLQPSLLAVRDAVRLKTMLTRDLNVPESRISSVINRYSKHATLDIADIKAALDENDPALLPSQYKLVNESLDMGIPVFEQAPNAAIAKALLGLHGRVLGTQPSQARSGLFGTSFFRLRG
jgi:pilus assembly protein CpaE